MTARASKCGEQPSGERLIDGFLIDQPCLVSTISAACRIDLLRADARERELTATEKWLLGELLKPTRAKPPLLSEPERPQ
jgi:hypothetical protein